MSDRQTIWPRVASHFVLTPNLHSNAPPPSDAPPFTGTASYYDRFRAPYAQAVIDFIVERYNLSGGMRALDLGCGPGTIAIRLSHSLREVVAVDPDADMIAEGRRLAAARGRQNIQWLQSRAEDAALGTEPFRVATIGQAFHWIDRDKVLRKLAILVADGGGLPLVNPGKRRPQESWEPVADQMVARFLGPRTRHPKSNPQEPEHEPALVRSEYFSNFTAHEFSEHHHSGYKFNRRLRLFDIKFGQAIIRRKCGSV